MEGRPTEVEGILGAVIELGKLTHIPTPYMDRVYANLTLPTSKAGGFLKSHQTDLQWCWQKHPTRSKQLPGQKVLQLRLLFFCFGESIAMPVRYAQHPAIICPLTIPNQVGYVRCRDFSALGCFFT